MLSTSITVTTTPTLIVPADDTHREVYLHVTGNGTVYIGGPTVSTSTGTATQKHTTPIAITIPQKQTLYAIIESGTEDIRVLTPDVD